MIESGLPLLLYGLLIGLVAGAIAGSIAGLSGLGGGLIYVPLFYLCLPAGDNGIALPVFASMIAVIITSFFSARSHWRLGHVDRQALSQLLPGLAIGAGLGLWSTLRLPETSVLLGLAALNGWVAFDYGRELQPTGRRNRTPSLSIFSGPIGFVSGMFGIGGGTMLVPLLRRILPLRSAVGTAAACGLAIATASVTLNLLLEPDWHLLLGERLPLLAGVGIGVIAVLPLATRWSAGLHSSIAESNLRQLLKGLFLLLSAGLLAAAATSLP